MVKVESDTKKDVKSRAKEAVVNEDGTLTLVMGKKGQRYPTESPGSGDYVFYDTLYKENPRVRWHWYGASSTVYSPRKLPNSYIQNI